MTKKNSKYKIVENPVYKYKYLDPIPREEDIEKFYQSKYYDLLRKGGRAPELRRMISGGKEAKREKRWLRLTLYTDILAALEKGRPGKLLDVGCGTGEFISFMKKHGWDVVGIEPAAEACAIANRSGLCAFKLTIEQLMHEHPELLHKFNVVTMLNVLEHVPDPIGFLRSVKKLLAPSGKIIIRVPNDFTEFQQAAQKRLKKKPWWIAIPDHINYFTLDSLTSVMNSLGFETVYSQGDFPMELFLFLDEDYVGNPKVGNKCHQKRVNFELAISSELRRRIYRATLDAGLGRNLLVVGKMRQS